ncbi:MAG: nicotinamide-nucleotide amidohydrolase family protein [Actinomycetota bacterium]|jgi:nicotinamide-nucleotide amidase|nr:nicotinamide-nucleotide amidohydrolase family protein [Actinomycetota bacterium]
MRVEIVAVGTELLLGQIADTNSAWLGQALAAAGVDSHFHQAVGDNHARIVLALRTALARADAVIVCGGLGPTQDDITREAVAEVMNVALVRDEAIVARIAGMFGSRGREMPESNARQADVPVGAEVIEPTRGTAPGLICPVGHKVLYAVPGVPHEMADMFERAISPDLRRRQAELGELGVIVSRVLRTWGASESALAEALQGRFDALGAASRTRDGTLDDAQSPERPPAVPGSQTDDPARGGPRGGALTLAFLASGIEGIKVRLTARALDVEAAVHLLATEELAVREVIRERFGNIVFGVDDETMETAIAALLIERGLTLGTAESVTGGLIASRLVDVAGASRWFRGGVVAYDPAVKREVLGVPAGPVVSEPAAAAMACGAARVLGADVGLGITGVAGPDAEEGVAPGRVHVGLALPGGEVVTSTLSLPGDRARVRQYSAISALDLLRRRLSDDEQPAGTRIRDSGPGGG